MGYIELCYDWNWVGAEKEYKRALELDPNNVNAHNLYAWELVNLGRTDEALFHTRQAISLDPYLLGNDNPIWVAYLARRYDEAAQLAKAEIALDTHTIPGTTTTWRSSTSKWVNRRNRFRNT